MSRMSPAENKRAKRRRAKRTGTKLGRPTRPLAPRNTTATDEAEPCSCEGNIWCPSPVVNIAGCCGRASRVLVMELRVE
ncbi:Hypp1966 [Branchiostoma lanceolatum]|uniref:Hypp1966 protein n=1 Tax=Branchiostoma lanceolatum TaxID=7740 RepID=A0A8K0EL21_BRALA|nr:Hypp1966 [Branchiostoma lanceolatum]